MRIPWSERKKALIVVDVQSALLVGRNQYVVGCIQRLIEQLNYSLLVETVFHAERDSLWDKQTGWILPKDTRFKTVPQLSKLLAARGSLHIEKETKSAFKGSDNLYGVLKKLGVQEVHIVGLDTNDCVLATAYEAFDLGFFTYVIEECTDASSDKMRQAAIEVLRHVNLTNNSCIEQVNRAEID